MKKYVKLNAIVGPFDLSHDIIYISIVALKYSITFIVN